MREGVGIDMAQLVLERSPGALARFAAFCAAILLAALACPAAAQVVPTQQDLASRLAAEPHAMTLFITGAGRSAPIGAAHGIADAARNRPLEIDTPFRIASNTKTFVAASVLRLWKTAASTSRRRSRLC